MSKRLGKWNWYVGCDENDDEMCECSLRDAAVAQGLREFPEGDPFFIIEARMRASDEAAMGRAERDTAPFAEKRNGEYIDNPNPRLQ